MLQNAGSGKVVVEDLPTGRPHSVVAVIGHWPQRTVSDGHGWIDYRYRRWRHPTACIRLRGGDARPSARAPLARLAADVRTWAEGGAVCASRVALRRPSAAVWPSTVNSLSLMSPSNRTYHRSAILHSVPVAQLRLWLEQTWKLVREVDHLPQRHRRAVVRDATVDGRKEWRTSPTG